jgi:hypothetical protein
LENFDGGELAVAKLMKKVVADIFNETMGRKYKYVNPVMLNVDVGSLTVLQKALVHHTANNKKNVGIATLQNSKLGSCKNYIAFNFIQDEKDRDKHLILNNKLVFEKINILNKPLKLCFRNENILPVKRLKVKNLETFQPAHTSKFALNRSACSERKILSEILKEMKSQGIKEGELGGTLYLYTKLEPCAYCMMAMQEFMDKTGVVIKLMYEDLALEMARQNFTTIGPTDLTDITYPTHFDTIREYDSDLAKYIQDLHHKKQKEENRRKSKMEFKYLKK